MSPRLLAFELCHRASQRCRSIGYSSLCCSTAPLHHSRVSFLTPLALKRKILLSLFLVCLLVNQFKKVMDYLSYLAVRGREIWGCDSFPRRLLLVYLLPHLACSGLSPLEGVWLLPTQSFWSGPRNTRTEPQYLSSCPWIFKLWYKIPKRR